MAIVDVLLKTSYEDTRLLMENDARGDVFSVPRDVDFILVTDSERKAEDVSRFIHDNRYGSARLHRRNEHYEVVVVIHMPVEQHILCSVSGLMACIAQVFGVHYDGWGCAIQDE